MLLAYGGARRGEQMVHEVQVKVKKKRHRESGRAAGAGFTQGILGILLGKERVCTFYSTWPLSFR